MNYYIVIHDVKSFEQHPDWIGRAETRRPGALHSLKPGDGIVYYCKNDCVVTGTFTISSAPRMEVNDPLWKGPHTVLTITPVAKAEGDHYIPMQQMLEELDEPLSIFPDRRLRGATFWHRTLVPITEQDFRLITDYVRNYR